MTFLIIVAIVFWSGWIIRNQNEHMAKLSELGAALTPIVDALNGVGAQLEKATAEILAAVTGNDPEVPAEVTDKIVALGTIATALKAASQKLDDLNTDTPAPEPAPTEPTPIV